MTRASFCRLASVSALVFLSAAALANPIGGMDFVGLLIGILLVSAAYEIAVWLVEAWAYTNFLKVRWRFALGISFVANAASLAVGLGFFGALLSPLEGSHYTSSRALIIRLVIALAIEVPIIYGLTTRLRREDPSGETSSRVLRTAIGVNAVTNLVGGILFPGLLKALM